MLKIYICARPNEKVAGEENYQPISNTEKIQLNPIYIKRIKDYISNLGPPFILISRNPLISILLDAGGFVYETFYS